MLFLHHREQIQDIGGLWCMCKEVDTLSLFPLQVQSGSPSMWRAPGCPGRPRWACRGGRSRESPAPAVSVCWALLGKESALCWEQGLQGLQDQLLALVPALAPQLSHFLRLAVHCRHCCPRVLHCHTEQRPSGLFLNLFVITNSLMGSFAFFAVLRFRNYVKVC